MGDNFNLKLKMQKVLQRTLLQRGCMNAGQI